MATEQRKPRDNSGFLMRNRKKKSENHPDFTGSALIGGKEYWLSGWVNESAKGNRYTSLAFREKAPYQRPKSAYPAAGTNGTEDEGYPP